MELGLNIKKEKEDRIYEKENREQGNKKTFLAFIIESGRAPNAHCSYVKLLD